MTSRCAAGSCREEFAEAGGALALARALLDAAGGLSSCVDVVLAGSPVVVTSVTAEGIDRVEANDAEHPGDDGASRRVVARAAPPHREERVLYGVLGAIAVTQHPVGDAMRPNLEAVEQLAERVGVTVLDLQEERVGARVRGGRACRSRTAGQAGRISVDVTGRRRCFLPRHQRRREALPSRAAGPGRCASHPEPGRHARVR